MKVKLGQSSANDKVKVNIIGYSTVHLKLVDGWDSIRPEEYKL